MGFQLRTHEVLPSPTRANINKGNDRVLDADDVGEALDLDVEVLELTKKLDAVSGKQVSSEALFQPFIESTANEHFLGITDVLHISCHHFIPDCVSPIYNLPPNVTTTDWSHTAAVLCGSFHNIAKYVYIFANKIYLCNIRIYSIACGN